MPCDTEETDEFAGLIRDINTMPGYLVRQCSQLSREFFAEECKSYGITPEQLIVLITLQQNPGIGQVVVAERVSLDQATTGQIIARLIKHGLARRKKNPADTRAWQVELTDDGAKLLDEVRPHSSRAKDRFLEPLDTEERNQLLRLMRKLIDRPEKPA
ncbi:MarR family transcriptional regulator [Oricola sp.]|uniref:MarR family winged helix-turn-helix transcriptional regulator n=1 Tax=Oricola sp. TaxID=1979950 RepID=UPI0025FE3B94|nr:MarR family transcriptional regulator [Oricola sp.]MCI5076590.1 MarR family transcriptional regulator [Oricola sp.]